MGQMCAHFGAAAPGFTDKALEFHRTADTIAAAAKEQDRAAVLKALGATLQTCTGCHATFRQQIVDEATWNRLTGTPAPSTHP
jgi:mono/diheme cytochrome c family protein